MADVTINGAFLPATLNDTTPPAPSGRVNLQWQTEAAADGVTNNVSASVPVIGDVVGPSSAADSDFVQFDGTTGKLVKDGGLSLDTDGTLAVDSDVRVASQKAVKTYVDAAVSGGGTGVSIHVGVGGPNPTDHVQSVAASSATATLAASVTDGNLLVVLAQVEGEADTATATDTLGTVYTRIFASTGYSMNIAILCGIAPAGGACTVTWSPGGSYQRIAVSEFKGCLATVDVSAGAENSSSGASIDITTTVDADMLYCIGAGYHSDDLGKLT
jgi:hypothetical protein